MYTQKQFFSYIQKTNYWERNQGNVTFYNRLKNELGQL